MGREPVGVGDFFQESVMAENSKIEWTDHTFNPWEGCQKVSPGCDNCYAEARNARFGGGVAVNWGPGAPRRRTSAANWRKPLQWQANAAAFQAAHARRQRVFCSSLADVFDNAVDPAWRADLFSLIAATPDLDWLLLTKRIGNWRKVVGQTLAATTDNAMGHWTQDWLGGHAPANVWIGATIVNQEEADRDLDKLDAVPAAVRFLSMEPLLGPVDLGFERLWGTGGRNGIEWVIVGGESGHGARPMHPDWPRSLRDQCAAAGVPFLFKQWGEWAQVSESPVHPEATRIPGNLCRITRDGVTADHYVALSTDGGRKRYELRRIGKKAAGRVLDGMTHDGFPA
jgi:protein gp37